MPLSDLPTILEDTPHLGHKIVRGAPVDGFWHLRGVYSPAEIDALAEHARQLKSAAPFVQPTMRNGTPLHVKVTSWGRWGWWADQRGYRYLDAHPETRRRWPDLPDEVRSLAFRGFHAAVWAQRIYQAGWSHTDWGHPAEGSFSYAAAIDTCLVNLYGREASLGWHVDETERSPLPITTLSLGEAAAFEIELSTGVVSTTVLSGDVVIMGGASRRARHRIAHLLPADQPALFGGSHNPLKPGSRLSLTLRCTGKS